MIKNKTVSFVYPAMKPFIIEINSVETANGKILLNVPNLNEVLASSVTIFDVTAPTVLNSQWTRTGSDLKTAPIFNLDVLKLSTGQIELSWRLDASELSATDGKFYLVNILINSGSDSTVAQANVEFIIKITDIAVTGV